MRVCVYVCMCVCMSVWCIWRVEGLVMVVRLLLRVCVYVYMCAHASVCMSDVIRVLKVW